MFTHHEVTVGIDGASGYAMDKRTVDRGLEFLVVFHSHNCRVWIPQKLLYFWD